MTWRFVMAFSGLKTETIYKIKIMSEKVYNKHIIKRVTWSGVQYHVSWMRPYHWITLDASRLGWFYDMASSTRRDTVRQIKLLL